MTTATMTSIPMAIGGALFSAIGRSLLWATVTTIKAPVTTGLLVCMTLGTAYAATNALYMQTARHPAPFFADRDIVTSAVPAAVDPEPVQQKPVVEQQPVVKTVATPKVVQQPVTAKPAPVPATPEAVAGIDNDDVMALQQKLAALGHYEGDADGFYGPKTAAAIRAFEQQAGLKPVGALTPEVLKAVAAAKADGDAAAINNTPAAVTPPQAIDISPAGTAEQQSAATTVQNQPEAATRAPVAQPSAQVEQQRPQPIGADPLVQIVQKVATTANKAMAARPTATNREYVEKVQQGLASLGFLRGKVDGVAGEDTARAIRNFEVYYNYRVTGEVTPELIDLLQQAGAQI